MCLFVSARTVIAAVCGGLMNYLLKTWHKWRFKMSVCVKIVCHFIRNKTLVYKCKKNCVVKEGNIVGRRRENVASIKKAVKKG